MEYLKGISRRNSFFAAATGRKSQVIIFEMGPWEKMQKETRGTRDLLGKEKATMQSFVINASDSTFGSRVSPHFAEAASRGMRTKCKFAFDTRASAFALTGYSETMQEKKSAAHSGLRIRQKAP
jgi:hypothetical protein